MQRPKSDSRSGLSILHPNRQLACPMAGSFRHPVTATVRDATKPSVALPVIVASCS